MVISNNNLKYFQYFEKHEFRKKFSFDLFHSHSLHCVKQPVIFRYLSERFDSYLEQYPTEHKDHDGESNLPASLRIGTPPDKRQRQRPHTEERNDNKGFSEIPFDCVFFTIRLKGLVKKLAAVFTLYRSVLNLFSAVGALLHEPSSWQNSSDELHLLTCKLPFMIFTILAEK